MSFSVEKIRRVFPYFNLRPHTEKDFWRIIKREKIQVKWIFLTRGIRGYYCRDKRGRCYIVLDPRLPEFIWLWIAFHELTHHFLHVPESWCSAYFSSAKHCDSFQEREAKAIASMLLIPHSDLEEMERWGGEVLESVMEIWHDRKQVLVDFPHFQ